MIKQKIIGGYYDEDTGINMIKIYYWKICINT